VCVGGRARESERAARRMERSGCGVVCVVRERVRASERVWERECEKRKRENGRERK